MMILFLLAVVLAFLAYHEIVGEVIGADGTTPSTGRQSKMGGAVVSQEHGKYWELASRGRVAFASDQAAGIAATATSVSTVAIISLYNPVNSGKRYELLKVWCAYFSGTLVIGGAYHCVTPQVSGTAQTLPSGGTALTSYWSSINNLGLTASPTGVCRTGGTVVAPIVFAPMAGWGAFAGGAAVAPWSAEDMDGLIDIFPGGSYQLQIIGGTGTSPKLTAGLAWAELPFSGAQG